jgi:hypothetical protein
MKFLTPIFLILISIALVFWYINPGYGKIGTMRNQLATYENALERAQAANAKRNDLLNRYNSFTTDQLDYLQKLLPDSIDNIRLIVDLNTIAARYSSGIHNIRLSASDSSTAAVALAENNGPYGTLTVSFATSMTYSNYLLFMRDVEKNLRLMDVTGITFTPGDTGTYDFSVNLKTYWLK